MQEKGLVQRQEKNAEEEPEPVQTKQVSSVSVLRSGLSSRLRKLHNGEPLPASTRAFFEPRFGADFGHVRVHNSIESAETAHQINAQAFTRGRDIVFGPGRYSPGTEDGRRLLAHELVHVIQQRRSGFSNRSVLRKSDVEAPPPDLPCVVATEPGPLSGADLLFRVSSAALTKQHDEVIERFALQWAAEGAQKDVNVDGYASQDGSEAFNWRLSCERAEAVKDRLVKKGVSAGKITTIARGESTAFSSSLVPNRRVVISVLPSAPGPQQAPAQPAPQPVPGKYVSTLCHRDFTGAVGGYVPARHCFVWGHQDTVAAIPSNIQQADTITYDNSNSGTPDPDPQKATKCTTTFDVDPNIVRQQYMRLCKTSNYNLVSFNCCTCAYLALNGAGASPNVSDFPAENHGMALPFGSGWKKSALEFIWLNDIDEIEDVMATLSNSGIQALSPAIKTHWIKTLISGTYCTEAEGKMVIKLFQNTPVSDRPKLYQMVEGHSWAGDWKSGVGVTDDDMVDALSNEQLGTLKDIINGVK